MKPAEPTKGHIIIGFTPEQMETYNVRLFGDKRFVIADNWNPDFHSIEEGVVVSCNEYQEELKPGQSVLIDYAVFTAGRHKDRKRDDHSRAIGFDGQYYLYWCYDDTHEYNTSEIYATLTDEGKVKAFGDAVIIFPHNDTESDIEVIPSLHHIFGRYYGTSSAVVQSSPVADIAEGDMIIFDTGLSPTIFFRGIEMRYINLPYIFGIISADHPYGIKLF